MKNEWDEVAPSWDTNEAVLAYAEQAFASLQTVTSLANKRVLDFGCGTGLLTERLAPVASEVVGLDPSPEMLAVLESKDLSGVSTIDCPLSDDMVSVHPLLKPKFDLIVASSSLAFVPNYQQTLTQLAKLLRPGGYLVQWDWLLAEGEAGTGFSEATVCQSLQNAGLVDCQIRQPFAMGDGMAVVMGSAQAPSE